MEHKRDACGVFINDKDNTLVLKNMNKDIMKKNIEQLSDNDLLFLSKINEFFNELTKEEMIARDVKRTIDAIDKKYISNISADSSSADSSFADDQWSKRIFDPFTDKYF